MGSNLTERVEELIMNAYLLRSDHVNKDLDAGDIIINVKYISVIDLLEDLVDDRSGKDKIKVFVLKIKLTSNDKWFGAYFDTEIKARIALHELLGAAKADTKIANQIKITNLQEEREKDKKARQDKDCCDHDFVSREEFLSTILSATSKVFKV